MRIAIMILGACGLLLAGLGGCSGDRPAAPAGGTAVPWSLDKTIGPSEIVLALDVSDAVGGSDLEAMIAAVGAALGTADLVPADGSIAVAAFVYGDTVAAPFDGLVAVTPGNLEDVILPALAGLAADRLVGGTTADLAGALESAGLLLATGLVSDQHLLVLGSGAAADTAGVGSACAALAGAGIMVSAVTLGEGAPLESCADATGGWFAGLVTDPGAATAAALAYMLQADLTVAGSAAELPRGGEFTATATLFRGGDPDLYPVAGGDVVFTVVAGPNAGAPVTAVTDTAGRATLTYVGEGAGGVDTVVAAAAHPGTGTALTDTVTVSWLNTPPACDAGGPYLAVVDADTVRIMLDGSASADADGDTLTFAWSTACDGAVFDDPASATPQLTLTGACLCVDTLAVVLQVGDGFSVSECATVVVLDDQRPPVFELRDDPLVLWPPNHKYGTFTPDMFVERAEDACGRPLDLAGVEVVEVRSDEPEDDNGDGRTLDDIVVHCPNAVMLRAERRGGGDGRVYTIVYRLTDGNGAVTEAEARVVVPHDNGSHHAGEDAHGGYTVVPDCGADR